MKGSAAAHEKRKPQRNQPLRPDWLTRVYKYRIWPIGSVPPAWEALRRASEQLWNLFVCVGETTRRRVEAAERASPLFSEAWQAVDTARARVAEAIEQRDRTRLREHSRTSPACLAADDTVAREIRARDKAWDALKEARDAHKQERVALLRPIYAAAREAERGIRKAYQGRERAHARWQDLLRSEMYQTIHDRFRRAEQAAYARPDAGFPRCKGYHERVTLERQIVSGGLPIARLSQRPLPRFHIVLPPGSAYRDNSRASRRLRLTRGHWTPPGSTEPLHFRIQLHRPLPPDGYIQRVRIAQESNHASDEWFMDVIVQAPPQAVTRAQSDPTAALHIGWAVQHLPDGTCSLRIASVAELYADVRDILLPISGLWKGARLRRDRFAALAGRPPISREQAIDYDGWPATARLQQEIDAAKDSIKEQLTRLPLGGLPQEVQGWLAHLHRVGRRGLLQIEHLLSEIPGPPAGIAEACAALRSWSERDARLRRTFRWLWGRLVRFRTKYYEQQARDLCRRYREIRLGGACEIAQLAQRQKRDQQDVLQRRYRQWAAPGSFVAILKQMASKFGTTIIEPASGASRRDGASSPP